MSRKTRTLINILLMALGAIVCTIAICCLVPSIMGLLSVFGGLILFASGFIDEVGS